MHLVMFDIDGTLVESFGFDSTCFSLAVHEIINIEVDTNWDRYKHVTDTGILMQLIDESNHLEYTDSLVESVKQRFVLHVKEHLNQHKLEEVHGAARFVNTLLRREDVVVTFATGGWLESAQAKLIAAGFNTANIPIATSSDHYSRTEIMMLAEERAGFGVYKSKTYFGDGEWDQQASQSLGYNFVLIGDRINWEPRITDYSNIPGIIRRIGL